MWFAGGGGNRELRPLRHKMATSQKQEASKGERASLDTMGKNKLIVFIGGNTVSRWTMDTDLRELHYEKKFTKNIRLCKYTLLFSKCSQIY